MTEYTKKSKRRWMLGILALLIVIGAVTIIIYRNELALIYEQNRQANIKREQFHQIVELFKDVSRGTAFNQTTYYEGQGIHPIICLDWDNDTFYWTWDLPDDWRPPNETDLELIVYVGDQKEIVLEVCPYTGPSISRIQWCVNAELREAKTGEIIDEVTLYGSRPRPCRQWESYGNTRLEGSRVSVDQLIEWLEQYVTANP